MTLSEAVEAERLAFLDWTRAGELCDIARQTLRLAQEARVRAGTELTKTRCAREELFAGPLYAAEMVATEMVAT